MSRAEEETALIDYVLDEIAGMNSGLTRPEWISILEHYLHHDDPSLCARDLHIPQREAERIYYKLAMVSVEDALKMPIC